MLHILQAGSAVKKGRAIQPFASANHGCTCRHTAFFTSHASRAFFPIAVMAKFNAYAKCLHRMLNKYAFLGVVFPSKKTFGLVFWCYGKNCYPKALHYSRGMQSCCLLLPVTDLFMLHHFYVSTILFHCWCSQMDFSFNKHVWAACIRIWSTEYKKQC